MNKEMTHNINKLSAEIHKEFSQALEKFGTYACDDKGVGEVMILQPWVDKIKTLNKSSASELFNKIVNHKNERSLALANELLENCDDMSDEWFEYILSNSEVEY